MTNDAQKPSEPAGDLRQQAEAEAARLFRKNNTNEDDLVAAFLAFQARGAAAKQAERVVEAYS